MIIDLGDNIKVDTVDIKEIYQTVLEDEPVIAIGMKDEFNVLFLGGYVGNISKMEKDYKYLMRCMRDE